MKVSDLLEDCDCSKSDSANRDDEKLALARKKTKDEIAKMRQSYAEKRRARSAETTTEALAGADGKLGGTEGGAKTGPAQATGVIAKARAKGIINPKGHFHKKGEDWESTKVIKKVTAVNAK